MKHVDDRPLPALAKKEAGTAVHLEGSPYVLSDARSREKSLQVSASQPTDHTGPRLDWLSSRLRTSLGDAVTRHSRPRHETPPVPALAQSNPSNGAQALMFRMKGGALSDGSPSRTSSPESIPVICPAGRPRGLDCVLLGRARGLW
jgi:hypothetical protein